MDYSGLDAADLADVRTLNITFLDYLASARGARLRQALPLRLRPAVKAMTQRHIQRLATAPFLLASCREDDTDLWQPDTERRQMDDLFLRSNAATGLASQITSATLVFLWQLSRRNSYAARMVCGAALGWCEQLADSSVFDVLQRANSEPDLISPRRAGDEAFWHRLLGAGLSSNIDICRAAHLSALQTVLTPVNKGTVRRFQSAACSSSVPVLQVQKQFDE